MFYMSSLLAGLRVRIGIVRYFSLLNIKQSPNLGCGKNPNLAFYYRCKYGRALRGMTPSPPYPSHLKENFNSVIELLGQLLPVRRSGWDERSSASSCLSGCIPACRDVRTDQVTNEKERKIFLEFKRICCFTS